jgi:murein DD-endopeptidase MepM/ murein hydrolase activator NlpD
MTGSGWVINFPSKKGMLRKTTPIVFVVILLFAQVVQAGATGFKQTPDTGAAYYVVQAGDSLWDIAARFRLSVTDLADANGITDPSQLGVGQQLIIPGLEGVQGELTTRPVVLGEDLAGISRRYGVSIDILNRLNHLTSPAELYAGSTLVLPLQNAGEKATRRLLLDPGLSLFELAVLQDTTPWGIMDQNGFSSSWKALPGDVLHLAAKDGTNDTFTTSLPEAITGISLRPERLVQGKAAVIEVIAGEGVSMTGLLNGLQLHFFPDGEGKLLSYQGIHAMTEPGLYPLVITGTVTTSSGNSPFEFNQSLLIISGNYPFDPVLSVSPETIDPAVTGPENAEWAALMTTATAQKLWNGPFTSPIAPPLNECWPSRFGNRRSYNGSDYSYFHSGLDFCGGVGTEILAPAGGKVVFIGPLTVRGNATVIDHGWGIYSAYLHQSEILVNVGDIVVQGQLIGKVGGTGRVTGPHLHWEIWAGGVQVDPMDWLENTFP